MTESPKPAEVIAEALDPRTPARDIQGRLIVGALRDAGFSIVPTEATRSLVSAVRHLDRYADPNAPDCLRCVVDAALNNKEG